MSKKSTNIAAIVAFVIFLLVILAVKGVGWMNLRAQMSETQEQATEVAEGFASGNQELVTAWSNGECVDPWDNQFVLVSNSHDAGVAMASRGPDGEWGTEDDIESDIVAATRPNRIFVKKTEKKGKLDVVKEKASGAWGKVKGFFARD